MRTAGQTSVVDLLIGAVAVVAVAALGYFGVGWWTSQTGASTATAASTPTVMTASLGERRGWTEADSAACEQRARAAMNAPMPEEVMMANPAVTEGFAHLATLLECNITTKSERFCDQAQKSALVAMVNDYINRANLVVLGLNAQGAPMSIMGGMMGGEVQAGSEIYNIQRDGTIDFMRIYNQPVADGLRALAENGVISEGDFGAFLGVGVPPLVKEMLAGVERTGNICA